MMKEQKRVPNLRFAEFSGEWATASLQDLCRKTISYGIVQTGENIEKGIPCVRVVDLTSFKLDVSNMIKTSKKVSDSNKKTILEENEIMLALRGEIGLVRLVEKELVGANLTRGVARISTKESIVTPSFMNWVLQSENSIININKKVNGSALKEIPLSALRKVKVFFSKTIEEQQKIASFLSTVDKKIQQLQQKNSLLEQYKKGVMQQLFPSAGSGQVPQLRFTREDGSTYPDWEEKRLGEIGEFQTSSVDKLSKPDEKEVFLVNYMDVYNHNEINNETVKEYQIVTANDNQIKSCDLRKGDVLFTPSSETPDDIGHSVVIFEDIENAVYSYHVLRFRPNIELDILYSHYFCNNNDVLRQLSRMATGSTRFTISKGNFSKVVIKLPNIEEQTQIAQFLSSIDKKIAVVQTQIEHTQQFKKGLLQQMFV
ncbi:restriction endonuclease subunit S [Flagellimonas amoyensis]|uniref:restriction endonuclease subunit S n=1 Tax=Flagellimonas amoyensis TaxID=2169401 RepID=UPI000D33C0F4|nr:restriction endonuclease subunit S [Allomuricauda amoyensis]